MLENFFKFKENNTDLKTEILAGLTTFLAIAYILGVNPTMLADGGMPASGVFFATAISSGIACIIMGLLAKYPVGLAPGMGLNALFTYTIIQDMGNTWETALAATFISSMIFLIISISGLREKILNIIPLDLKLGIGAGIGFFLAFLGLKSCGIIISDPSTYVSMGTLAQPATLLALIGVLITLIFYVQKVPAAVFFGLLTTAIIGVIFTLFGFGVGDALMPTIPAHPITTNMDTSLFCGFTRGFGQLFTNIPNLIIMVFSLVFVTFFDTTGTLMTVGRQCGFVDENGHAKGIENAFLSDALGGIIGSIWKNWPNRYRNRNNVSIINIYFPIDIGIIYSVSNSCCIGYCWSINGGPIKRSELAKYSYCFVSILNSNNDDIKLFNLNRYCMGILNLCYRNNSPR